MVMSFPGKLVHPPLAPLAPEWSWAKACRPSPSPPPRRSWGRAAMSTAETVSAVTGAALMRTQEVPAHCPSQVSRLARPSGLGNVCSKACWGKPF